MEDVFVGSLVPDNTVGPQTHALLSCLYAAALAAGVHDIDATMFTVDITVGGVRVHPSLLAQVMSASPRGAPPPAVKMVDGKARVYDDSSVAVLLARAEKVPPPSVPHSEAVHALFRATSNVMRHAKADHTTHLLVMLDTLLDAYEAEQPVEAVRVPT